VDEKTCDELRATGKFTDMDRSTDEDEHSIEMHLPYIRKVFENADIKIIPILVGAISREKEAAFGQILSPYFLQEDTFFVVSSDFCHWGTRFSYTHYYPSPLPVQSVALNRKNVSAISDAFPIHMSISELDHEAMAILAGLSQTSNVHEAFASYLGRTRNTICGRHPIGVLIAALESLSQRSETLALKWVHYEQSSPCMTIQDSSVSYASAYVVL